MIEDKINGALPEILSFGTNLVSNLFPTLINISVSIIRVIVNLLLSIVISCYMLSDKNTLKKNVKRIVYSFLSVPKANVLFISVSVVISCGIIYIKETAINPITIR